ncbi:hypothetical protein D3C75_767540 [compost metagenome]
MAAHRAKTRAGFTQMAAQQLQVDDFAHRIQGMFVLGNPHRPGADHALGLLPDAGGIAQLRLA